jgi:hypothetical protein
MKEKKKTPFDFLNSITYNKKDILEDDDEYNQFIINRGLSQFNDCVFVANEMNRLRPTDRQHYDFCLSVVRKNKRFGKWAKKEQDDSIPIVMEYYGYSRQKAISVLPLLNQDQISSMKSAMDKGGRR